MSIKPTYEELEQRNRELEKRLCDDSSAENQKHYLRILDCSSSVIYTKDLEGHYTSINKQFENLSGFKREEVIGKTDFELFPSQVAKNSTRNDKRVIQTGVPLEIQEYGPVDGKMHSFTSTKYPLLDEEGKIYGICGISTDITIRSNAEQELKNKDRLFRTAITHSPIAMVVSEGINQNVIMINDRFSELFGYTQKDIPDVAAWWLLAYPDEAYREKIRTIWTKAVEKSFHEQSQVEPMEVIIRCKDGTFKEVIVEAASVGKINLVTFFDMTERKHTEKLLASSLKRYDELVKRVPVGVYVFWIRVDGHMEFEYVSDRFCAIFQVEREDVITDFNLVLDTVHPDEREDHLASNQIAFRDRKHFFWEGRFIVGGKLHWLHIESTPEVFDNGDTRWFGIIQDITEKKLAEIALIESETQYRNLAENTPAVAFQFHMSKDGVFSVPYISKQVYQFTGVSARQAMHDSSDLISLIQPEQQQLFSQSVNESARFLQPFHEVFEIHVKGVAKWLEVRSTPQRDKDGNTTWNGFFHDVTERILTEKALQESEWKFQALFTNGPIGVAYHRMVYDQNDKAVDYYFIDANQKYLELTGVDPRGKLVTEAFPGIENDPFDWIETFGDVARNGKTIRFQQHLKTNDRWYDCVGYQYQPDHFVAAFLEITEQKKIELQLEKEEKQFRTLFEKSNDAIFIVDRRTGQYLNANNAALESTGRTLEELCRLTIHDVTPGQSKERIRAVSEHPKIHKFGEVIYKRPDGTERIAILTSVPLDDNRAYGIARDITDTLLLEKQLDQAQKMESVGRLAGGVAHDFNNMLSVIIGNVEMGLEDIEKDSRHYERLEEIRKAAKRSADLTRQLLAFARKQTISPKVIDLNKNIESTLRMLKRLIGEDIDLKWIPRKKLWPVKVDPSQIDQILTNLCVNSRDAIKDIGKITIETDTVVFDESYCSHHPGFIPGEYVLLAVSDNGSGMNNETISNIFEPFFTTKEPGQGTGLGLATVYGAVKQNQGFVNVYSEPGQGTTFKIYLPRYEEKGESFTRELKDKSRIKGQETILLVEDESAILSMITKMLERLGYHVLVAETPGKAIRIAQEHEGEIHLLITDVIMPEMNGRDLAKTILSLYPNLKRLFMSGYTANVIAHHGVLDEGVNFINKPFSPDNLGVKIREVLDKDGH